MVRALVCGGRDFSDVSFLNETLDALHKERCFSVVIEGGASGADALAKRWALCAGIEVLSFPANWTRYHTGIGHSRNRRMLDLGKPDIVIAFAGGKGTKNMMYQARFGMIEVVMPKRACGPGKCVFVNHECPKCGANNYLESES